MNSETPTFCKEFSLKTNNRNFSSLCESISDSKCKEPNSAISLRKYKKGLSLQVKKMSKFKHENVHDEHKKKKKHHSHKFKKRNYDIHNVTDFIKNHKFKLRNDFDKKHVEKFLLSKEEAFKIPFLLAEELSSTSVKS